MVELVWNQKAYAQKPGFVFRRNGRVHLNRRGRQFSRLLAAEVCASAVVMLDTPRSEVVWRVLATYSIRQFPLHVPSRASPCAIRFQTSSTWKFETDTVNYTVENFVWTLSFVNKLWSRLKNIFFCKSYEAKNRNKGKGKGHPVTGQGGPRDSE